MSDEDKEQQQRVHARWDDSTGAQRLIRQVESTQKHTQAQWWMMFVTPAAIVAAVGVLLNAGYCSPLKAFPWATRAEVAEIVQPIKEDVADLKAHVESLPGKVVDALEQKRGRR